MPLTILFATRVNWSKDSAAVRFGRQMKNGFGSEAPEAPITASRRQISQSARSQLRLGASMLDKRASERATTNTSRPSRTSRFTSCEPMKPVPPRTATREIIGAFKMHLFSAAQLPGFGI